MYCPRCDKTMDDAKLGEVSETLRKMGNTLLERGKCPVCSTDLIRLPDPGDAGKA
ncbi:MAG: hypothetical protein KIS30_08995 [Thermoplasmata archaeon]|nr:hypothetical protein [Candidatus Sysuiplasma acidicola]MBX8638242.1 hypothetical protein [Candidatus Sysuiplasma acidicola]MBX8646876.1 hypothetical protein [Candidatus Sysuiplasma acidicola]MDH2905562.1 hypothetical protein [Methanomassiliicoccales archaeon]